MLNITIQLTEGTTPIGTLHGWRRAKHIKRDAQSGAWEIELPVKSNNVGLLDDWLRGDVPGVIFRDADSGWAEWGILSEYDVANFGDGSATRLKALGTDVAGLLAERIINPATWPGFNDPINLTTNEADSSAWDWVNVGINSASRGIVADLGLDVAMIGAQPSALPVVTVSAHGGQILEQARAILAGSNVTVLASFPRVGNESRQLQLAIGPRPVAALAMSSQAGNVQRVNVSRRKAARTWVQGIGEEDGATTRVVYNGTSTAGTWNTRLTQGMLSNPQFALPELTTAVEQELAINGPKVVVSATDPDPSAWGDDLDVGHLVDVSVPLGLTGDIEFVRLPVVQSTLVGEAGTWTRTVDFGEAALRDVERLLEELVALRSTTDRLNRSI